MKTGHRGPAAQVILSSVVRERNLVVIKIRVVKRIMGRLLFFMCHAGVSDASIIIDAAVVCGGGASGFCVVRSVGALLGH